MNDTIRVLIIDDNRDIADEIREYLAKSGNSEIEIAGCAYDGKDGLEKIAALQPDAVILDIVMPVLDGIRRAQGDAQIHRDQAPRGRDALGTGTGARFRNGLRLRRGLLHGQARVV